MGVQPSIVFIPAGIPSESTIVVDTSGDDLVAGC